MTEAILAGEKVKELAFEKSVTVLAAIRAKLAWFSKDFLVRHRPRRADESDDSSDQNITPPPATQAPATAQRCPSPSPPSRPSSPDLEILEPAAVRAAEHEKRAAFDKQWETAKKSPEEVLGASFNVLSIAIHA